MKAMAFHRYIPTFLFVAVLVVVAPTVYGHSLVPATYVELQEEEVTLGQYLVVDSFDGETGADYSASLLVAADGSRYLETDRLDRDEGEKVQRWEDLSSGWAVEFIQDFGFDNLGDPGDYASPMEWSLELRDRALREKAPTTYTIRLDDGRQVQWTEPFGEPEVGDEARRDALAELATIITSKDLPASTRAGLELLARLRASEQHPRLTADRVFDYVWKAYSVASGLDSPQGATVRRLSRKGDEADGMLRLVERDLDRWSEP